MNRERLSNWLERVKPRRKFTYEISKNQTFSSFEKSNDRFRKFSKSESSLSGFFEINLFDDSQSNDATESKANVTQPEAKMFQKYGKKIKNKMDSVQSVEKSRIFGFNVKNNSTKNHESSPRKKDFSTYRRALKNLILSPSKKRGSFDLSQSTITSAYRQKKVSDYNICESPMFLDSYNKNLSLLTGSSTSLASIPNDYDDFSTSSPIRNEPNRVQEKMLISPFKSSKDNDPGAKSHDSRVSSRRPIRTALNFANQEDETLAEVFESPMERMNKSLQRNSDLEAFVDPGLNEQSLIKKDYPKNYVDADSAMKLRLKRLDLPTDIGVNPNFVQVDKRSCDFQRSNVEIEADLSPIKRYTIERLLEHGIRVSEKFEASKLNSKSNRHSKSGAIFTSEKRSVRDSEKFLSNHTGSDIPIGGIFIDRVKNDHQRNNPSPDSGIFVKRNVYDGIDFCCSECDKLIPISNSAKESENSRWKSEFNSRCNTERYCSLENLASGVCKYDEIEESQNNVVRTIEKPVEKDDDPFSRSYSCLEDDFTIDATNSSYVISMYI